MGESYKDLVAWQKAMHLASEIYQATQALPRDELYGLVNQLRRDSDSVPSKIAEGQARTSAKEFRHFLGHARGSLVEIETQLMMAHNLGCLAPQQSITLLEEAAELGRILNSLIASGKHAT
jgi:four helix bundle protein